MNDLRQEFFETRHSFRSWLETNHDNSPGIWMVFFKKHTGIPCITYAEALEEALCFGWIDSLVRKVDEERYIRKFTPRSDKSGWSGVNLKLAERLINEGRMTGAGVRKLDRYRKNTDTVRKGKPTKLTDTEWGIPDFILESLASQPNALTNFLNLTPSCKRQYILWITEAKREETILKRLRESIALLLENKKLGLK